MLLLLGRDINLEILRVEGYRKFCNKIFNATKFAMLKLDEQFVPEPSAKVWLSSSISMQDTYSICFQPTGKESLVEKWIFHKLNLAAEEVNRCLTERNFMAATTAAHNFWLYELCDVYIVRLQPLSRATAMGVNPFEQEAMKPMTDETVSAETRRSAQNTLYTCLDQGLRLLHPFMPFVTEELWQRLPRHPNDHTPSIMLSAYPVYVSRHVAERNRVDTEMLYFKDKAFEFEQAEKSFDLVFSAIRTGRSLAAQYSLQTDIRCTHAMCYLPLGFCC